MPERSDSSQIISTNITKNVTLTKHYLHFSPKPGKGNYANLTFIRICETDYKFYGTTRYIISLYYVVLKWIKRKRLHCILKTTLDVTVYVLHVFNSFPPGLSH